MGGSGSKRRVVVEDVGPDGVVTVTEDVVRRLKGLPDKPTTCTVTDTKQTQSGGPSPAEVLPGNLPNVQGDGTGLTRQDVETFYLQKLKDLQERNNVLQHNTNQHFATAVKDVENKFMNFTTSPVCQELQMKVMECYQNNAKETLNCSALVNAFSTCVDRARMAASASRLRNVSSS